MRAILLDGTPHGHDACRQGADALRRALTEAGHRVEAYVLADLPMAPCRGCFACWTGTPGRCPFEDASQMTARALINAELAVFYSPVSFGVWHSTLKKALDRSICLVSPHFEARGLTRHKARYERFPAMLGVGWLPGPDPEAQELFGRLVEHNAYNLRAPAWAALVVNGARPWASQREACLAAIRGVSR